MNLMDILMKLWDEDKWREQQAKKLSSGLGSLPYNAQDQMQYRSPLYLEQMFKDQKYQQQWDSILKDIEKNMGSKQPDWFEERFLINQSIQDRMKANQTKKGGYL